MNQKTNGVTMSFIKNCDLKQTLPTTGMESGMKRLELMISEVKLGEKRKVENFKSRSLSQSWDISFGESKLGLESLLCSLGAMKYGASHGTPGGLGFHIWKLEAGLSSS